MLTICPCPAKTELVKELVAKCLRARDLAYCPYSRFPVGAAILTTGGDIITGCNVENASFGLTVCAERTAIQRAVAEGYRHFTAIAVTCDIKDSFVGPCGACRQVLMELSGNMEAVVSEVVAPEDLMKFEKKYNGELAKGVVSKETKFEYAWCLIRSKYSDDIKKGVVLLEELVQKGTKDDQRDYLFYLSVANYRLKEYEKGLKYIRVLLKNEPGNTQALELEKLIDKALKKGCGHDLGHRVWLGWDGDRRGNRSGCGWLGRSHRSGCGKDQILIRIGEKSTFVDPILIQKTVLRP
ncbi:hypothetical protein JZ751_006675 [Albula glossodonta]|uniref:Mitochondrial fission 1 protein n=1 Tax=Albula glossodonta TaxID=121402 RepID=A0A8T2P1Q1_9TELE|nr:hypothetical protein JZ751_006675 [Albula glossodonta]